MPAERTSKKALRQTTLFGFTKAAPRPTTKPSDEAPASDVPVARDETPESDEAVEFDAPDVSKLSRVAPPPPTNTKRKGKSKAIKEDRVLTDVLLSIKPEFTKLISERKKNHEYRKYKLQDTVVRLWLYETAPTSAITYVMETSRPKVPGEVNDSSGIGNDDFDNGLKQSKYGYPVEALYKLRDPVTTAKLKERFDIAVPQGWRYATKKLVEGEKLEDMEKLF
ncbi:uncharacterized protein TRAVEDRAFT_173337 [Trametes versicolor FP-101664 SS1]|uniref:uncharacterized protein n=1 Tax=Trametes versicolor (strain FP-101664) TaxID=717944 RepID=UPI0004621947|nr:uncharacterized protein TRAVEDRAFT_173337 [Trametes versicolor FP-101664 SS1]EIW54044.1 hypothetical protein TRAVEDRAFT_173337 [Trametes versicolor FP-101664 SS1]